jgi:hypothetical protein
LRIAAARKMVEGYTAVVFRVYRPVIIHRLIVVFFLVIS